MTFIRTSDGTNLYYRDWGSGEPIVFVASQSVSSDLWNYNLPFFADQGFRCIAFDRRGHGRSDEPGTGYDIDTLARDLGTVVSKLELGPVTLVGHSLGGAEVIRYAAQQRGSGRIRRVVLLAPTAPFMTKTDDNPDGRDRSVFEGLRRQWTQDFPRWIAENARPFFTPESSPELLQWGASLMGATPLYVHLRVAQVAAGTDLRGDLARIDVPALFVHGERDASVPFALGKLAASMVPGSSFVAYSDAAHGLLVTHAARMHRDVLEFVRS
jgi:pimeloyl-ACP methyl ester carboxylesterase